MKPIFKRLLSCVLSATMAVSAIPIVSAHAAEGAESYPYTMFAASSAEGAITINSGNFCVNGNVATNGTIISSGNMNVNGIRAENADESMIFIFNRIDNQYFSASNVDEHNEDYTLEELNININVPTEVQGEATLTGNININNALKALEDINLYGEVKNTNESVIFSKYGDIIIDSQNVNLNGLVYAPFGSVTINAQNLNLNNVVIIAESIVLTCPNVNANNSSNASSFVGTTSDPLDIPYGEWQYMKDENENDFPDFFENPDNWKLLKDTDGDQLPDCVEQFIGTDATLVDSDSDMLDDYYEVFVTGTDPVLPDTDNNGIADGDEDFDTDGLTNYQEYVRGTSPWDSDSDSDDLSDGDEVNIYSTNPLEPDTDNDGLSDSDEIALGTNPNLPDTDGDGILDGEERFAQTFVYNVESEDCAVEQVIVSMEGTGNLQNTMSVDNIMDKDVICGGVVGLVGVPFAIETTSEFESATLSFKIDQSKLGKTDFDDLLFLWYDEDNHNFVELDTIYDETNSTVSVETTHFSRYMVVDKYSWFEAWSKELNYTSITYEKSAVYSVLAVDCSGSMSSCDPITIIPPNSAPYKPVYSCERQKAVSGFTNALDSDDKAAIVTFESSASTVCGLTDNTYDLYWGSAAFYSSGGTSFDAALRKSIDILQASSGGTRKRIILLSDGYSSVSDSILTELKEDYIKVYTVGIGNCSDSVLRQIATETGGEYIKAYKASELISIYSDLGFNDDFDTTDTDGDKLYDTVESAGIRLENGNIIYTDPTTKHTDSDGLEDGEEIDPTPLKSSKTVYNDDGTVKTVKGYYFIMKSDPRKEDTDGDGINDYKETNGVTFTNPEGNENEYEGEPLKKGLADGIVGNLTIVSDNSSQAKFWDGHAFLLYESYINDTLDFSGFARGFKYTEDGDGTIKNNWNETPVGDYKISPNRVISIGNYSSGDDGWADISGSSGSGSSGSSSSSGSGSSTGEGNGIHFNMELRLLYSSEDGTEEGAYVRSYGNNAALTQAITANQLESMLEYENTVNHYNFVGNNCAEIAGKSWNKAFDDDIDFRIWTSTPTPAALKKSIENRSGNFKISFHSNEWKDYINKEVVDW